MQILVYTHFYYPEAGAGSIRMQYFVESLRKSNNEIKIVSPIPNYPSGKIYNGFKNFYEKREKEGIYYLPIYIPRKYSLLKRGLSYLSYFFSSLIFVLFWDYKPDLIITSSPPISTALAATIITKIKRIKMILDLRDIWPDIGIELGLLKKESSIKLLKRIEKFILNSATSIVVTAKGDKINLLEKGVPEDTVRVIFNGADPDLFKPLGSLEINKIRKAYGIPLDKKVLIYFGSFNYGMNDLNSLSDALINLEKIKNEFVFVALGDGDNRKPFITKVSQSIICIYLGTLKSYSVAKILAASDISLIPRKSLKEDTGGNTPVKCFESWAAGIPVVLSAIPHSEIANIFREAGAGILTEPDNPDSLRIAIQSLLKRNDLKEIGLNARKYVEVNYNRNTESKKLEKIVANLNNHTNN